MQDIDNFLSLLNKFENLNIKDSIDFEKMNDVLISHHSTAIEGSTLTEEETRLLLLEGLAAKGKPLVEQNMVADHHKALLKTLEFAREKKTVTPEVIRYLSSLLMKNTGGEINTMAGSYDSSKGDFRLSEVHVGARYFTSYQKVPDEVCKLCTNITGRIDNVKSPKEIYDLSFDAHFGLVSIHPFADGNGRVSRLLMNYILEYHKQPLALIFKEDKIDYYNALEESRKEESIQPFRDFMYSQQEKYFSIEIDKFTKGNDFSYLMS